MDSRLIPACLAAGWLLLTLGVWGWAGQRWWIWPLSLGVGLLVVGAVYAWAAHALIAAAAETREIPEEVRT